MNLRTLYSGTVKRLITLFSSSKKTDGSALTEQLKQISRKPARNFSSSLDAIKKRDKILRLKTKRLLKDFKTIYPDLEFDVEFAWSGAIEKTKNGFPYSGRLESHEKKVSFYHKTKGLFSNKAQITRGFKKTNIERFAVLNK